MSKTNIKNKKKHLYYIIPTWILKKEKRKADEKLDSQFCSKSEKSNFLLCAATRVMIGSGNGKAGKRQVNPIIDIHFYPSAKQR